MTDTLDEALSIRLPIEQLPCGEIAPPVDLDHESWQLLQGWDDPLAPRTATKMPSGKTRIDYDGLPAIEWQPDNATQRPLEVGNERALVTGEPTWREYSVECRLQGIETHAGPTNDGSFIETARAGIAFRIETSRRHYYFCLEAMRRLVLYRRIDDEWFVLAARDVAYTCTFDYHHDDPIITLRVELDADGIRATCPELSVDFFVTDTTIPAGRVGFRALGACRLFDFRIAMTTSQRTANDRLTQAHKQQSARLAESVPPECQVDEIRLPDDCQLLQCADFCRPGRNDLLFQGPAGLLATTWDGDQLWRFEERTGDLRIATDLLDDSRRIYTLVGYQPVPDTDIALPTEIVSLDGATGATLARTEMPLDPYRDDVSVYLFGIETGCLTSDRGFDFILRHCRAGMEGGGNDLWAYDGDLNPLWHQTVTPPYGHGGAVHLADLDADGRSEVIAGGTVVTAGGDLLSQHDMAEEMYSIWGAGHYDALVAGNFADDPQADPVAFLIASSAGVYITDPLTGRTRAVHRIGHAQWGKVCKVRDDLPGQQVLAGTRWNNFGIMTLFSGRGDRLWTVQPDYVTQGSMPVQWLPHGPQHIWVNTSAEGQGLYDGHGRLVIPFDSIRKLRRDRIYWDLRMHVLRRSPGDTDLLGVALDGRLLIFGPQA